MRKKESRHDKKNKTEDIEEMDEKKLQKIDEEIKKNKIKKKNKTKDEKSKKRKKCIINLLVLAFIIAYFLVLMLGKQQIPNNEFTSDLINFGYFFLALAIFIFEIAYKKDRFDIALFGIESLVVAGFTQYILYLFNKNSDKISQYFTYILGGIGAYYIIKIIVILVKKRKK